MYANVFFFLFGQELQPNGVDGITLITLGGVVDDFFYGMTFVHGHLFQQLYHLASPPEEFAACASIRPCRVLLFCLANWAVKLIPHLPNRELLAISTHDISSYPSVQ